MATQDADDVEITEARPRKRIRSSTRHKRETSAIHLPGALQLFVPFRALGLITNHIPFYLQTRSYKDATDGPRIHILTCLGRSWALWEGGKMGLLFVGELLVCLMSDSTSYFVMLHRSGSPRPYFVPCYGWRCCLGSIWHTCDQISPRQRGKGFYQIRSLSSVANVDTGFTRLEFTPDPLSIRCSIWLSVACVDGRWWANADMGCIDERFAFCLIPLVVLFINSPRTGPLCKPSV